MIYLAHSASKTGKAQTYEDHVQNVYALSRKAAETALHYAPDFPIGSLLNELSFAAIFHDLGKLEDDNQDVLTEKVKRGRLPISHADAGSAYLVQQTAWLATLWVYSHHRGLPNLSEVEARDEGCRFRDDSTATIQHTNQCLPQLLLRHDNSVGKNLSRTILSERQGYNDCALKAIDCRLLFGCLTDADHGDTAAVEDNSLRNVAYPRLRAGERLKALRENLQKEYPNATSERDKLRSDFFDFCAKTIERKDTSHIMYCDAPVGSGKTTAVMAHLLSIAENRGLKRVFVVLPYTNIISQSVECYREMLCLEGENPRDVVAEIHHRADFADVRSRKLTSLWRSPIIVTTAVAFFETLASATPSTLRRLHNLAGSAVFLDEAHAMLPLRLMPLAWRWIQHLAQTWSCHWVLGSGSLFHFWEWEEFGSNEGKRDLMPHNLLEANEELKKSLDNFEGRRIVYKKKNEDLGIADLVLWLISLEGPVIVVVNTVSSAAFIAQELQKNIGGVSYTDDSKHCAVYHISTALCPSDRELMIKAVKERLTIEDDTKWFLVATSCVEAGLDFSFRTGVRESASLLSLLQLAGRVNRNAKFKHADVWTIKLQVDGRSLTKNPAYDVSSRMLDKLSEIDLSKCTEVVKEELRQSQQNVENLLKYENNCEFKTVESKYHVIPGGTVPVIVDQELIKRIESGSKIDWQEVQMKSVSIRNSGKKFAQYAIRECSFLPGLYFWTLEYNRFIGYMAGGIVTAGAMNGGFLGVFDP